MLSAIHRCHWIRDASSGNGNAVVVGDHSRRVVGGPDVSQAPGQVSIPAGRCLPELPNTRHFLPRPDRSPLIPSA